MRRKLVRQAAGAPGYKRPTRVSSSVSSAIGPSSTEVLMVAYANLASRYRNRPKGPNGFPAQCVWCGESIVGKEDSGSPFCCSVTCAAQFTIKEVEAGNLPGMALGVVRFVIAHGPTNDDECLFHTCNNPECGNPAHFVREPHVADLIIKINMPDE